MSDVPGFPLAAQPQKVAFCGSHGTGKTTLARALLQALERRGSSAELVPEVPRVVCDLAGDPEFFRRARNSVLRQMTLLVGQPIHESLRSQPNDILLCDRTLLDHWAYTLALFREELKESGLLPILDSFVASYCNTYSRIFYIPIEFEPVDDGTREGDGSFQAAIDSQIRDLLGRYDIPAIELRGSVDDRARLALEHITRLSGHPSRIG